MTSSSEPTLLSANLERARTPLSLIKHLTAQAHSTLWSLQRLKA